MENSYNLFLPLLVCLGFIALLGFFCLLYKWARTHKGAAMAFGMFVQIFLPDPKVQQTIEIVSESKQEQKAKSGQFRNQTQNKKAGN
jgi:hypothetical protein